MRLQIALEDSFLEIAKMIHDKDVVILIDRGLLDGSAYLSQDNWQALMDDMGCSVPQLSDNRYDAVLHMVTAADGAENFYASVSNEARYESSQEAILKDRKLREAYMRHRRWTMISNNFPDFNSKIKHAEEIVLRLMGH